MTELKELAEKIKQIDAAARRPEEQAKAIMIAKVKKAFDKKSAIRTRVFTDEGISRDSLQRATKNWFLHMVKFDGAQRFIMDEFALRWLWGDNEIKQALVRERTKLYSHLQNSSSTKDYVKNFLGLSTTATLEDIQKKLESGNLRIDQISRYDKLVEKLVQMKLYNKNYKYQRIGWRQRSHFYYLAWKGAKLLDM